MISAKGYGFQGQGHFALLGTAHTISHPRHWLFNLAAAFPYEVAARVRGILLWPW